MNSQNLVFSLDSLSLSICLWTCFKSLSRKKREKEKISLVRRFVHSLFFNRQCFVLGRSIGKALFTPISSHVINLLIKHLLIILKYFVPCKVVPRVQKVAKHDLEWVKQSLVARNVAGRAISCDTSHQLLSGSDSCFLLNSSF